MPIKFNYLIFNYALCLIYLNWRLTQQNQNVSDERIVGCPNTNFVPVQVCSKDNGHVQFLVDWPNECEQ